MEHPHITQIEKTGYGYKLKFPTKYECPYCGQELYQGDKVVKMGRKYSCTDWDCIEMMINQVKTNKDMVEFSLIYKEDFPLFLIDYITATRDTLTTGKANTRSIDILSSPFSAYTNEHRDIFGRWYFDNISKGSEVIL